MKCFKFVALVAALVVTPAAVADFADPSFESPLTYDGAPFIGTWEGFDGDNEGPSSSAFQNTLMPRNGAGAVELAISVTGSFAGVFQDISGLTPGQEVIYSGWNKLGAGLIGPEVRIEWRTADNMAPEVSRTANLLPVLGSEYSQFSVSSTVPAGATVARAVYAIQTFGPGLTGGNSFIDDFSFTVVPEPASAALAALTVAAGVLRRRAR